MAHTMKRVLVGAIAAATVLALAMPAMAHHKGWHRGGPPHHRHGPAVYMPYYPAPGVVWWRPRDRVVIYDEWRPRTYYYQPAPIYYPPPRPAYIVPPAGINVILPIEID